MKDQGQDAVDRIIARFRALLARDDHSLGGTARSAVAGTGREAPATESEARALGCTCTWIFRGAINHFDPACPILGRHYTRQ